MADVLGIKGFSKAGTSVNILLAAYGNDIQDTLTNAGYGLNLTNNTKVEMEVFLDNVFYQNYSERPMNFDGTSWTTKHTGRMMTSKYIKNVKALARLYLGFCKFTAPQVPTDRDGNEIVFPSRVFHSDLYAGGNLTWGMEWGTNGKTTIGSPYFEIAQPLVQDFVASNIKTGDPLVITYGDATLVTKEFRVKSVVSPFRLELTENMPVTASSLHYWIGSNWFDIGPDNNEGVTGLAESSSSLIIPKLFSLFYYTGNTLRQVPDALGTSSSRSLISGSDGLYYFHGSDFLLTGIYKFDGSTSVRISRGMDPYLRGMLSSNYDKVVAWKEGEELRWYLGDIVNTNRNIDIDNAVITLHGGVGAWDVSPIADRITCSTNFIYGNENKSYCGTSDSQVMKMATGNDYDDSPMSYILETKVFYPSGSEVINEFPRVQVIGRAMNGLKMKYRLWDEPNNIDDEWYPLGELSNDRAELVLPYDHKFASGIQFKFDGMDLLENDLYVEKISLFYRPSRTRLL